MAKVKTEEILEKISKNVNRVEVIDRTGRAYIEWGDIDVKISLQDEGRTIKVFVKNK